MTAEDILDELHMKLVEICKLENWNMLQKSAYPEGTRTFLVWTGDNKRAKVVITGDKSARFPGGDVTFTSDSLTSPPNIIAGAIKANMYD